MNKRRGTSTSTSTSTSTTTTTQTNSNNSDLIIKTPQSQSIGSDSFNLNITNLIDEEQQRRLKKVNTTILDI